MYKDIRCMIGKQLLLYLIIGLSNVLSTRQTRYDQNYKAINDAYSKVVFADLSREKIKRKEISLHNR